MTAAEAEKTNELSGSGSPTNMIVDAAILSTKHSWIVDNYLCGAGLGTLTVWGSVAEFWRGPVGRSPDGYSSQELQLRRTAADQPAAELPLADDHRSVESRAGDRTSRIGAGRRLGAERGD